MVFDNVVAPLRGYVDDKNIAVQKISNILAIHFRVKLNQKRLKTCIAQCFKVFFVCRRSLDRITRFDKRFCQWQAEPAASENSDGFFVHECVLRLRVVQ